MSDNGYDILSLLIDHEMAVGRLYRTFSSTFPERATFWQDLAGEEAHHAELLTGLRGWEGTDPWLLYESRIKAQGIKTSLQYVQNQTGRAAKGELSPLQALSIARDLESSLLERQFFRLRNTAPPRIRPAIAILADETERHLKTVLQALRSEKIPG